LYGSFVWVCRPLLEQPFFAGSGPGRYNKVLVCIDLLEDLHTISKTKLDAISSEDGQALSAKIKGVEMKEVLAHFHKARKATGEEFKEHMRNTTSAFALKRNLTPGRLNTFRSQIQLKIVLQKCIFQKIGLLTFLACNRLDCTFVFLSDADKAAKANLGESSNHKYRLRLTLLSVFLSGVTVDPKYRVRYMRYTIKVNMAMQNYGLAAQNIKLLLKYAKSNTDKLKKELALCEDQSFANGCATDDSVQSPGSHGR
jgi:hypothetical protein